MMKAAGFFETSGTNYPTTESNNAADLLLNNKAVGTLNHFFRVVDTFLSDYCIILIHCVLLMHD
jgi:hypothetical protein